MTAASIVAVTLVAFAPAAPSPPGLLPLSADGDPALSSPVALRSAHTLWLWAPRAGEKISLRLRCNQVGRYVSPLEAVFPADAAQPVARAEAEPGHVAELSFSAPRPGLLAVEVTAGNNSFSVAGGPRYLAVEATRSRPIHTIGPAELYFYVPPGAGRFWVTVRGQGTAESAKATIISPEGQAVASGEAVRGAAARLDVAHPSPAGAVWKLVISEASEGTLEDVWCYFEGDVAPYVFLSPASALVPFCYGLHQQPRLVAGAGRPWFDIGISSAAVAKTSRLRAAVTRAGQTLAVFTTRFGQRRLAVRLPSADDAAYGLRVELIGSGDTAAMADSTVVEIRNGVMYVGGLRPILSVVLHAPPKPTKPVEATVQLELADADARAVEVAAELYRCGISQDPMSPAAQKIAQEPRLKRVGETWTARSPAPMGEGTYEWVFIARDKATGRPLVWQRAHWVVFRGRVFPERQPAPAAAPLKALASGRQAVVVAVPADRDAPSYGYLPSAREAAAPLRVAAARGQRQAAVVALVAARDIRRVSVKVSDLAAAGGARIAASDVDIRVARYWAQRTSWRSGDCWVVPELLERRPAWPMRRLQLCTLWLTFAVPAKARPGVYKGQLSIAADDERFAKPVELTVYPFRLLEPSEYHWGLYTDSARWRRYSSAKVAAELQDYRAHGITSLMMYPLTHSTVELDGGKLKIDAGEFIKYMDMARRAGLRPPTVLSFQSLASVVNRLLGPKADPNRWAQLYRDIALYFARLAKQRRWGEVVFHAIDEPTIRYKTADDALRWLGILKRAGLTTFTTALDPKLINGPLDPMLDVRCWSVGYVLSSKQANAKARADARRSGDRLWYYGSGCYTGQEGRMRRNRWLCGFGLWLSGAEGDWSWTFLRPKESAFNDFDGARYREAKDAMIAYPSEGDGPPIPTPQWEGIREGAMDFAYLYTARKLAQQVGGGRGRRALAELQKLTAQLPWGVAPPTATPQVMDRWRDQAAAIIRSLQP